MPETIISDTSCFIVLTNISELELLKKVYNSVTTTPEVKAEFGSALPDWVKIKSPADKSRQQILEITLDKGEASAIALALEMPGSTVILDDDKARKVAEKLKLDITGTLGVIIKAKLQKIIPSIKPYLTKLHQTDFRMSTELISQALLEAKET